jgi:transposase
MKKEMQGILTSNPFYGVGEMLVPEDVDKILAYRQLGWGTKRIAREVGIHRKTVRRYVQAGGYAPYATPQKSKSLDGLEDWLKERFFRHRGNADVIRQELIAEHGLEVSLRTLQRAVKPYRDQLEREARATVRFETPPAKQIQVDFGETWTTIAGERTRVYLCVLTLGFSRRIYVQAFGCARQAQWFEAIEGALHHFGGVPREILVDNARALVETHDVAQNLVIFHPQFKALCDHWGMRPIACAPYRARTKGKDERAVGYVKRNAIAGRQFESWSHLQAHLVWWMREVADVRVHATLGERPIDRFRTREACALEPLCDQPGFEPVRTLMRKVHTDLCVEVDTNRYSVPYRYIGRTLRVEIRGPEVLIFEAHELIARHKKSGGGRQRVIEPGHLDGVVKSRRDLIERSLPPEASASKTGEAGQTHRFALLRPLSEYERLIEAQGGGQ